MKLILIFLTLMGLLMPACVGALKPDIEATVQAALAATQAAQPTATPTPQPTYTPILPTATSKPTATPRPTPTWQPTPTPPPTASSIPGWEKFAGGGVELWLPDSFEGGNLYEDLEVIVEKLKALGPNFRQMAQMLEQNRSAFVLWVFDSQVGDTGGLTNVTVAKEKVLSVITIDTYLKALVQQLPSQFRVIDQKVMSRNPYPVAQVVVEGTIFSFQAKEILYIVKVDNTIWLIMFATDANEFDRRLPIFNQSIRTFTLHLPSGESLNLAPLLDETVKVSIATPVAPPIDPSFSSIPLTRMGTIGPPRLTRMNSPQTTGVSPTANIGGRRTPLKI